MLTQVYRQYKKSELPFYVPTAEEILNRKPQLIYDCGKLWVADIKRPVIDVVTDNYILDNIYYKCDLETKAVFEKYVNMDYKKIPLYTIRLCWFIPLNLSDKVYRRRWAVIDCETGAIVRLDTGTARELMLEVMKIYGGTY
ncbi:MAG: hypothetical protein M0R46_16835 [Candidatus Muirbacterium halophilum]|nr:hypothetical protein [Candidatus Muirbacterium halophilum]MCK9477583.1 hypothetical protein [Candidatus Muirbacterium halophilum]